VVLFVNVLVLLWVQQSVFDERVQKRQPTDNCVESKVKTLPPATRFIPPSFSQLVKRFPKYMIVGFGKAGTKALYEALKLHPSLTGLEKEPM